MRELFLINALNETAVMKEQICRGNFVLIHAFAGNPSRAIVH
jgi:hypothetical protein